VSGIVGIGIDLIEVARVTKVCTTNKRFVERIFANSEIEYSLRNKVNPYLHLAACWAAKEAFYKATNVRCSFRDVVDSVPEEALSWRVHLSISHIKEYATAIVVVERL